MFISNEEKKYLFNQIKLLTTVSEKLEQVESRLNLWEFKVRALEVKFDTLYEMVEYKKKTTKPLTPEQKEKQRGYAKAYHARQKALRAA
jgi:IS30 family transposase